MLTTVVVLLAAGGGLAWANAGSAAPGYRTALVSAGDVEQLLTATGTVQNVDQTKVSFPVTGTVATVTTQVGATVSKGQALASLDTAPLNDAVLTATAALAKAKATLETDSAPTTPTTTTTAASSPARTTAPTSAATGTRTSAGGAPTGASAGADKALADSAALLAVAQKSLDAAAAACGTGSTTTRPAGSPAPSLTAAPTGEAPPTASPTTSPTTATTAATTADPSAGDCSAALTAAMAAQQEVAASQVSLNRVLQSVTSAAGTTVAAAKPAAATPAASPAAGGGNIGGGAAGGSQGTANTQSQAARITMDQAAVAAADVALAIANRNLAGATLTSPIAGRIASQPFVVGASSGTLSVVIVAPGAVQATANVPATAVPTLKVGQPAAVTPDGASTAIAGTVAAIGLLPTSSTSGSTTTYPVRVLVTEPGTALVEGAAASVAITVKAVKGVLTVPNSALSDGTVTVLSQGKTVVTRVQTGAVGPLTTEVTSGLQLGQQVVLADLGAALPANSTTSRGFGATGGPPGAGGISGGAPGGGQGVRPGG